MPYKRKPRVLKRKNIKRRTGAKAQSKQISALSKQVSKITKQQYETIALCWNRPNLTVDTLTGGTNAYICPLPVSMCNAYGQNTILTQGDADQRIQWTDNLALASMDNFRKNPLFGSSENARDSPCVTHMGSVLNYRLINAEPSFGTYTVYLIRPKRKHANQLVVDRQLKNGTTLNPTNGAGGSLQQGIDYITHPDVLGTTINKKYYSVLYKKTCNFSHPGATGLATNVNPSNTNTRNNATIAEGTIRIPGGHTIRNFNKTPFENPSTPNRGFMKTSASQIGLVDEPAHSTCYLVVVNNGVSADAETVNLSFIVKDYYKAGV
jgi:hypothetical protein